MGSNHHHLGKIAAFLIWKNGHIVRPSIEKFRTLSKSVITLLSSYRIGVNVLKICRANVLFFLRFIWLLALKLETREKCELSNFKVIVCSMTLSCSLSKNGGLSADLLFRFSGR